MNCPHPKPISLYSNIYADGKKGMFAAIRWCPLCQKTLDLTPRFSQALDDKEKRTP